MRYITFALLAVVGYLAIVVHLQSNKLAQLQQQQQVSQKHSVVAGLDSQAKCASQAEKTFQSMNRGSKGISGYVDHFNPTLNKCLIAYKNVESTATASSVSRSLMDAYEYEEYGTYLWINNQGKKYWEVAPMQCDVTLPSGETKTCNSSDEYDQLTSAYMR